MEKYDPNPNQKPFSKKLTQVMSIYSDLKQYFFKFTDEKYFKRISSNINDKFLNSVRNKQNFEKKFQKTISNTKNPTNIISIMIQKITTMSMKIDCKLLKDSGVNKHKLYKISLILKIQSNADEKDFSNQFMFFKDNTKLFEAQILSNNKSIAKEALSWHILEIILENKFSIVLKYYPLHLLQKYHNTIEKSENDENNNSFISNYQFSNELISEQNLITKKKPKKIRTRKEFRERSLRKYSSIDSNSNSKTF